ncbi:MAG: PQQ-binding-like beta-propeller repeat protein [Candidatus Omnitrophota bacterium]|nr:PQQ-binding-like beta-propeller repeat protein [Candidatus Omnitrophota bacterium]
MTWAPAGVRRLLRAPLWWLAIGAVIYTTRDILLPNVFILLNYYTPSSHDVYRVARLRPDYLLYLPNVVIYLGYLFGVMVIIELKQIWWPVNRTWRQDLATAGVGLALTASSMAFMGNMKPGLLQLALCSAQVLLLWGVLMANAGLFALERLLQRAPWVARLWDWTFPISDVLFYVPQRRRLGPAAGVGRLVPTLCYLGGVVVLLSLQGRILWSAMRAELVPVPVPDVNSAVLVEGGIWFANSNLFDARSGLWYYDEQTRTGRPVIRTADTRRFLLEDGVFYYQDRYARAAFKVDAATQRVIWRVPTQPNGTFEVVAGEGLLYVVGEGGYVLVLDREGRVHAERELPMLVFEAQAVWGQRMAFVSGDPRIRIWDSRLTEGRAIPLPLRKGVVLVDYNERNNAGLQIVTSMTAYSQDTHVFYAGTFWGEIFRYDMRQDRWLPSFRTHMCVRSITADDHHRLLFLANYFQGYLDVRDRDTGEHLAYILANGLARYVDLDPKGMRGTLSTHGYGLYRFRYDEIVRRRASQLAARSGRRGHVVRAAATGES